MAARITHIVLLRSTRRLPNAQELPKHTEHLSTLHKMRTVLCTRCSQVQNSLFKIICVFCFVYDTLTTNQCKLWCVLRTASQSISILFDIFPLFAWLIWIKFYLYSYLWGDAGPVSLAHANCDTENPIYDLWTCSTVYETWHALQSSRFCWSKDID